MQIIKLIMFNNANRKKLTPLIFTLVLLQSCQEQVINDDLTQSDTTTETQIQTDIATNIQCTDLFEQFESQIWNTLSSTCQSCHSQNTEYEIDYKYNATSAHESFITTTQYILTPSLNEHFFLKPSNQISHDGGIQLDQNSSLYDEFESFTQNSLNLNSQCNYSDISSEVELQIRSLEGINRLDFPQNYQKALLTLTGQNAPISTINAITSQNQYKTQLRNALQGSGFTEFLMNGANDHLLTLKFANPQSFALENINSWIYQDLYTRLGQSDSDRDLAQKNAQDLLNTSSYNDPELDPAVIEAVDYYEQLAEENWDMRKKINRAIAEEPLRLIDHVVQNDRPYTEVITADYMMVNGYSNEAFNGAHALDTIAIDDHQTWIEGYIASHRFMRSTNDGEINQSDIDFSQYELGHVPNSGILSSPAFLMRFPSTDTNKNRARARWTYQFFLGVDIERLVKRAQDPEELASILNPNTQGSSCYGCHVIMEPVAGAFQSFGDSGTYLETAGLNSLPWDYIGNNPNYHEGDRWYRDNLAPGFNGIDLNDTNKYGKIEDSQFTDPIQWLGKQIIEDERFALATVKFWYPAVMSHDLLLPVEDSQSEEYLAYQIQENNLQELATAFKNSDYDLKTLLIEMTLTDFFTAKSYTQSEQSRDIELKNIGLGNILTPEQIDNKIEAITGQYWSYNWSPDTHKLIDDYYLFLGGIDSDKITDRTREINTMMIQTIDRMAAEMSCKIVLDEFNANAEDRKLFNIDAQTVPLLPEGYFVSDDSLNEQIIETLEVSDEKILEQIQILYQLFLNESLESDDPEITAIYNLWTDVWQSRLSNPDTYGSVHNGDNDNSDYHENCDVNWDTLDWDDIDWSDLTDIKSHLGEFYNPENTIRAWSAVLIYLMTDYQFIYQ